MEKFEKNCLLAKNIEQSDKPIIWKSLLNLTKEQVLLIDNEGKILFSNHPIFGLPEEYAIGKNLYELTPSTYLIILKSNLKEVIKTKKTSSFETLYKVKNRIRSFDITVAPVLDDSENIQGFALASIDTTETKSAKRKYNYKTNLEKLFLNISTKFISLPAPQIDEGIDESLELIGRFTNSEHAYIVLQVDNISEVKYQWHANQSGASIKMCSNIKLEALINKILLTSTSPEPILIEPFSKEYNLVNDCPIFISPMKLENNDYGAFVLMGKINSENDWSEAFSKPMMIFTNVFINTIERKKNALIEEQRKEALEKAIQQRTIKIEIQKNKLLEQAEELQKAEILVRDVNDQLTKTNSKLEKTVLDRTSTLQKTNSELDRFVYSVSHDIKAPLASVKGLINLIRLSPDDELPYKLDLMDRSIDKLNGFVEDILAHSRNSRVELKHELINFENEIELAAEDLRHMEKADSVKLITSINLKCDVATDQYRVQSVLKNLISNSIKYHNPTSDRSWVKVLVKADSEQIHIKVSDNGIGINEFNLDKIFDMFYRASEKSFGSGLGLYIVKETVEKLGGTIQVTSKEYVGTSFEMVIPNLA